MSKKSNNGRTGKRNTSPQGTTGGDKPDLAKISSYGVKRSTGVTGIEKSAAKSKGLPKHFWRWTAATVAVVLLGFGVFTYFRVTSFVDDSFSGRNEASLLTVTPRVKATATATVKPTVAPTPTSAPQTEASLVLPTLPPMPTATPVPPTPTPVNLPAIIQKIKQGEQISVLVTGYGGGQHDGAYLTDTILVMTYDPAKNAVTMVNVPRDLYVFIPYGGPKIGFWGKINSAFGYVMNSQNSNNLSSRYRFNENDPKTKVDGAINLLKDVVEQVTGIPIDYWATFSFDGFRKFIDAIGGVDVNVDTTFDDYDYPANDDPNIDASVMHIHFDAGLQHMTGEKAIEYARSRHSVQDGSDFGRSKRQMKLVQATKEKVAKPDIMLKAFGLMDALQGNLRTSLSLDEARALMDYFQGDGAASAKTILFVSQVLSTDNFLAAGSSNDGAYILWPYAGQSNYKAIQDWLARGRDYPELRSEALKVQVQNGTGQTAIMTKINDELEQNGLDTLNPAWANATNMTVIMDYSGGKSTNTIKAIVDVLPGVTIQTLKKTNAQGPDVVVLLGKDLIMPASNNASKPNVLNLPAGQPEVSPTPMPIGKQE